MVRIALLYFAIVVLLGLSSCKSSDNDNEPELGDFMMQFTGFEPHLNENLRLRIKEAGAGNTVAEAPLTFIQTASFTIELEDVLENGVTYNIDAWADVDGNGTLDGTPLAGGIDHAWRFVRTANAQGITLTYMHDTNFTDIRPF